MARSIGCSSGAGAAGAPDLMVLIGFEPIADELTDSRTICRFRSRKANNGEIWSEATGVHQLLAVGTQAGSARR